MIAFTYPRKKLVKSIIMLNGITGEAQMFEDESFNFKNTKTVVVKKDLYAVKEGSSMSVYKITKFTSSDNLVRTTLTTLPREKKLSCFAVTYLAGNIVVTGGKSGRVRSTQTYLMAV